MNYKTLKTNLQREILFQVIFRMRHKRLTTARARLIAQEILQVMQDDSIADNLLNNISKLCQYYPEISEAFLKNARLYEEELKDEKLAGLSFYLKNGDVDLALERLTKGGN